MKELMTVYVDDKEYEFRDVIHQINNNILYLMNEDGAVVAVFRKWGHFII